ncbi:MAG: hypothetical protein D8M58_02815 [Calditrichaeota bacterium]|nr:MAG: hypothetical protein DWQ03_04265 [Calditrichota bacterium]MBL1204296.1 hypothetical protein [Calditrichota bacterium]NOG44126.1 hypothetical protein [Calditrichota bacterium]
MKKYFYITLITITSYLAQNNSSMAERIESAVLAAPDEFRKEATVKGFNTDGSFTTLREGTNNMICLADDPRKKGFSVAAYHKDLEPFMARGRELRSEGKSRSEVFKTREKEAKSGKLKMAKSGATLHILSGPTKVDAIYRYVVYFPWATTETTGISETPTTSGGPWIMNAGTHKAHIMINPPASSQ